jgi:hypothetical protein
MSFDENLRLTAIRPPNESERTGSEGQRRQQQPGAKPARHERPGTHAPHPVFNSQGEIVGKLIDTEA